MINEIVVGVYGEHSGRKYRLHKDKDIDGSYLRTDVIGIVEQKVFTDFKSVGVEERFLRDRRGADLLEVAVHSS